MRHVLFCFFLLATSFSSIGQIGISVKQNLNDFPFWDDRATNALRTPIDLFSNGQEIGIDYWFKLNNTRIEFLPQLAYSRSQTALVGDDFVDGYNLNQAHLNLNTNIYFLDLKSDCDCPTFSKQGNFFTKGLFLQLSPGIAYSFEKINYVPATQNASTDADFSFKIGAALGFDIGISDLLTITPIVGYNWYPSVNWNNFDLLHYDAVSISNTPNETKVTQLQFGIRVGFRPDYGK